MSYQRAKKQALKYLAIRNRSVKEMHNYLLRKKYDEEIIRKVIDFLQDLGYLNDAEYCKKWIENRCNFKPMGKKGLYYQLLQKGIDRDLIEISLEENFSSQYELSLATQLAQKYIVKNCSQGNKQSEKLFRFLIGRGFDTKIAFRVIEKVFS